jgi:hypothetical protein
MLIPIEIAKQNNMLIFLETHIHADFLAGSEN